jgi:hypothetical protein
MYGADGPSVYPDTVTASPQPNKFMVRADRIRTRDGVSRNEAMRRARTEYPVGYDEYQRWQASNSNARKAAPAFDPLAPRGRTATHAPTQYPMPFKSEISVPARRLCNAPASNTRPSTPNSKASSEVSRASLSFPVRAQCTVGAYVLLPRRGGWFVGRFLA